MHHAVVVYPAPSTFTAEVLVYSDVHRLTPPPKSHFCILVDAVPGPGVVEVSDMSQLPFDADRFDVVYASHCLEHAPWDSLEATLNEWRRVLARGGTLCVAGELDQLNTNK